MDWNSKWDWENLDMFNSKATETLQKLQPADWGIVDGEIDTTSFNLSGGGGPGSGSDLGLGSSAKSSISASTDCSSKQEKTTSNFTFEPFKSVPTDFSKKNESVAAGAELNDTSPSSVEASVGSGEQLIGLKLGKRTYFENSSCTGSNGNSKTTSSFSTNPPTSSASTARKTKISSSCPKGVLTPRCQVEGCNLDLSSAKEYHKKHRVCETHSKSSIVVVAGVERRFCQQCSRFHGLLEFDEKKRSCRRRLLDHNARRRKPQQETLHFNSTGLSSTSYDGRQQSISFALNNFPHPQIRPDVVNSNWESKYSSKCTQSKGFHLLKPEKVVPTTFINVQHNQPSTGTQPPLAFSMSNHETNMSMFPPSRTSPSAVFGQGLDFKEPIFSSNIDAAPDFRRALSLLSTSTTTDSWGCSYEPDPEPATLEHQHHHHQMHVSHSNMTSQHVMPRQVTPQGIPLASSSEYWQVAEPYNHSDDARGNVLDSSAPTNGSSTTHFQEIHLFKAPQGTRFYSDQLN